MFQCRLYCESYCLRHWYCWCWCQCWCRCWLIGRQSGHRIILWMLCEIRYDTRNMINSTIISITHSIVNATASTIFNYSFNSISTILIVLSVVAYTVTTSFEKNLEDTQISLKQILCKISISKIVMMNTVKDQNSKLYK